MELMHIDVLDHGYVKLLRIDGSDVDVENSARASFDKSVDKVTPGFIERLIDSGHTSPLRCTGLWVEIKMPGSVKNQLYRHLVANTLVEDIFSWNELSFRGKRVDVDFYIPDARAPVGKWGQGDIIPDELNQEFKKDLVEFIDMSKKLYDKICDSGIAAENARQVLPFYSMYTTVRSRMSLEAAWHFYELRSDLHAQLEIRQYAKAIGDICSKYFPVSWKALTKVRGGV